VAVAFGTFGPPGWVGGVVVEVVVAAGPPGWDGGIVVVVVVPPDAGVPAPVVLVPSVVLVPPGEVLPTLSEFVLQALNNMTNTVSNEIASIPVNVCRFLPPKDGRMLKYLHSRMSVVWPSMSGQNTQFVRL